MHLKRLAVAASVAASVAGSLGWQATGTAWAAGVVTVPASIPADCSADVSVPLGAFLASVPSNTEINFPDDACYRVETEIDIDDKSGWVVHGNGTLLKRTEPTPAALQYPHSNAFLRFVNLSDSTIDGLDMVGINTVSDEAWLRPDYGAYEKQYAFDHGFAFDGATDVTLSDSSVDAVFGDGVYISGADQYTRTRSDKVRVVDVTINRNGRQGISVSRSSNVLIDGVDIEHSRRSGIDLEPDSAAEVISGIEIRNSDISSSLLAFASGGPGAVNDVYIHDNVVLYSGVPFVYDASTTGTERSNWRIEDNKVATLGSPQPAMAFANTAGVIISGNYVPVATTQSRLEVGLRGATNVQIRCNTFPGAGESYIDADATSSFVVAANTLDKTTPTCVSPQPTPTASQPVDPPAPAKTPIQKAPIQEPPPAAPTPAVAKTPSASNDGGSIVPPSPMAPSYAPENAAPPSANAMPQAQGPGPKSPPASTAKGTTRASQSSHSTAGAIPVGPSAGPPSSSLAGAANAAYVDDQTTAARSPFPLRTSSRSVLLVSLAVLLAVLAVLHKKQGRRRGARLRTGSVQRHPLARHVAAGLDVIPHRGWH